MAEKTTGSLLGGNIAYHGEFFRDTNNLLTENNYAYSSSGNNEVIINQYNFSSLPSNAYITGYKITIKGGSYRTSSSQSNNTKIAFRFAKDFSNYAGAYDDGISINFITSEHTVISGKTSATTATYENKNSSSSEIQALNQYFSDIKNGNNFGISIRAYYSEVYFVKLELFYMDGWTVLYDTEFNFQKWKEKGITSSTGVVSNITNTGFTMTANANDTYTSESHIFQLIPGETYDIKYETNGAASQECFIFYHTSESANWDQLTNSTTKQFEFTVPAGHPYCSIRVDVNNSGDTITFNNFLIVKHSENWRLNTVSSYTARTSNNAWNFPSVIRQHYTFTNWKDANGTVYNSSSSFPTNDIVLYSQWNINQYTVSTQVSPNESGQVSGGGTYDYNSSINLLAIPANGYKFIKWNNNSVSNPLGITITTNATYIAYFEPNSQIYVGQQQTSGTYVGKQKVSAVYIGTTKVL